MQMDAPPNADSFHHSAAESTSTRLDLLVTDIAKQLGCTDLPPTLDGHCELLLDGNRSLSIWPRPEVSGLVLVADLAVADDVYLEGAYRTALGYCLGAASIGAPVIGKNEEGSLVLLWTMGSQGGSEIAADGISIFLENLELADTMLAGKSVEEEAVHTESSEDEVVAPSEAVLEALAEALQLEKIELGEDGFGTFQMGNGSLVLMQYSQAQRRIALLAQVSTLTEGAEEELCMKALEYNYVAASDGEPVMGLDTERGGLFLITTLGAQDSAATEVEPVLELFLNRYAKCLGIVYDPDYEEQLEDEAEAEAEQQQPDEMPFGGIRV